MDGDYQVNHSYETETLRGKTLSLQVRIHWIFICWRIFIEYSKPKNVAPLRGKALRDIKVKPLKNTLSPSL